MPEVDLAAVTARVIGRPGRSLGRPAARISRNAQADGDHVGEAPEWHFEVHPAAVRLIGKW